jgi:hypothetical protein
MQTITLQAAPRQNVGRVHDQLGGPCQLCRLSAKECDYKLPAATDEHREMITMHLEMQSVPHFGKGNYARASGPPKPMAHCSMKMPGCVQAGDAAGLPAS